MLLRKNKGRLYLSDEEAVRQFSATVYRVALNRIKKEADVEDVYQEVFLRFVQQTKGFETLEHAKAWFIRVTINCCHDFFRNRKYEQELEVAMDTYVTETKFDEIVDLVQALDEKYRMVIHLYYYEQYKISEIATLLNENENTIKTRLARAKRILKKKWED